MMPSPSRIKQEVACTGKRYFADKRAAVSALNLAMKTRGRHGRAEKLRAYGCPICKGWHHTKQIDQTP